MEQGIEAIAIEVERISEGQRYVTNLLGEQAPRALSAPARSGMPERPEPSGGARAGG
jgi:hypothetical protein